MSAGVIPVPTCRRGQISSDSGVLPGIGKERGYVGAFAHLFIRCKLGQWKPFRPVILEVVDVVSWLRFHDCIQACRLAVHVWVIQ